jgi:hypothetical protein
MIDIFTANVGDQVEYQNYLCSESLQDEKYHGIYQGFTFWSPDGRPLEMWIDLIGQEQHNAGLSIRIRASQVTDVHSKKEV